MDWNNWRPKPGDKVLCTYSSSGSYTKGRVYEVKSFVGDTKHPAFGTIRTIVDDKGNRENGWRLMFFMPASLAAQVLYTHKENTNVNG